MTRPVDWSPLTDRDPFRGDPYTVSTTGSRYRDTADEAMLELFDAMAGTLQWRLPAEDQPSAPASV